MRFFTLIIALFPVYLFAQIVNIENRRIYDDTSGWSGSIDGGGSIIQNDAILYNLNFRPRVQYKTRKHYYFLLADLNYTASKTQVFAHSGMSHFRYARRIKNGPWKWENYAQVQYNFLLDQRIRGLVGSGFRWKMYDKNKIRVFIGSSLFAEHEEIRTSSIQSNTLRTSQYLSWFVTGKNGLSISSTTYYQPAVKDYCDIRMAGQYVLSFQIFKRIDLRFEYNFSTDTRPPVGVRKTVSYTSTGFRFRMGE